MIREPRKVRVKKGADLASIAGQVGADKEPRILEMDGRPVAGIVSIEDLKRLYFVAPSKEAIARTLAAAGAWDDSDADAFDKKMYEIRHGSPPSDPIEP